eukprot:2425868-Alexandrium_andersonii.AAC.1
MLALPMPMCARDRPEETKYRDTKFSITRSKKGEYIPLGVLIQREGGAKDKEAVRASLTYAAKCVIMGKDPSDV